MAIGPFKETIADFLDRRYDIGGSISSWIFVYLRTFIYRESMMKVLSIMIKLGEPGSSHPENGKLPKSPTGWI